jgi:FMN reductase
MLGAGPEHALAPEHGLAPLLAHLGAVVPTGGLYVLDKHYDDPDSYEDWLQRWRPVVRVLLDRALLEGAPA